METVNSDNFYGARLRTLIDTAILSAIHSNIDLTSYNERNKVIDQIENRLSTDEFNAIVLSNGTTFTKSSQLFYVDKSKTAIKHWQDSYELTAILTLIIHFFIKTIFMATQSKLITKYKATI